MLEIILEQSETIKKLRTELSRSNAMIQRVENELKTEQVMRRIIMRAMGESPDVDVEEFEFQASDILHEIEDIGKEIKDIKKLCKELHGEITCNYDFQKNELEGLKEDIKLIKKDSTQAIFEIRDMIFKLYSK